jgi:hypothetical protein
LQLYAFAVQVGAFAVQLGAGSGRRFFYTQLAKCCRNQRQELEIAYCNDVRAFYGARRFSIF